MTENTSNYCMYKQNAHTTHSESIIICAVGESETSRALRSCIEIRRKSNVPSPCGCTAAESVAVRLFALFMFMSVYTHVYITHITHSVVYKRANKPHRTASACSWNHVRRPAPAPAHKRTTHANIKPCCGKHTRETRRGVQTLCMENDCWLCKRPTSECACVAFAAASRNTSTPHAYAHKHTRTPHTKHKAECVSFYYY